MPYLEPVAYKIKMTSGFSEYISFWNNEWSLGNIVMNPGNNPFIRKTKYKTLDEFFEEANRKWGGLDKIEYTVKLLTKLISEKIKETGWKVDDENSCLNGVITLSKEKCDHSIYIYFFGADDIELMCNKSRDKYCFTGKQSMIIDSLVELLRTKEWKNDLETGSVLTVASGGEPTWSCRHV